MTWGNTAMRLALGVNAIDAAPCASQQMFFSRHRRFSADHFLKQLQLRAAESLTTLCGSADRTMVFDQQPVLALFFDARHITLCSTQAGQLFQFSGDAVLALSGMQIVTAHFTFTLRNQALKSFFAKELPYRSDQLHRQVGV